MRAHHLPVPYATSDSPIHPFRSKLNATRAGNRVLFSSLYVAPSHRGLGIRSPLGDSRCCSRRLCAVRSMRWSEGGNYEELETESDFATIASSEGMISVCGFGSLLSERSARSTFPDLENFRVAVLRDFRRVFAHVAPIFYERGIAIQETGEVSSLSVEPCKQEFLIVTMFEIKLEEVRSFMQREHEFRYLAVSLEGLDGGHFPHKAVICARYSDEEYFQKRCQGDRRIFYERYGRFNIDKIWRDDILPCRIYLRHCVLAAKNLGEAAYNNFLDHTYLGDRKTTIREHLASKIGSRIMEEQPPELLRIRYGG